MLSYFVTMIHCRKHKIWLVQKGHLHFKCILFSQQMIMKQYEASGLINKLHILILDFQLLF